MSMVWDSYPPARLVAAFILPPALPVLIIAALMLLNGFADFAFLVLLVGGASALLMVLSVVMPLYWWLKRSGRLHITWAALAGGAAMAAFVFLAGWGWALSTLGSGPGVSAGVTVIENGVPTAYGALLLFVLWPAASFAVGAPLGLVGWLIAFGFRSRPSGDLQPGGDAPAPAIPAGLG
jgi:hypothetical protein